MSENIFQRKFETKTDAELARIIDDDSYIEQARKTAIQILKDRNVQTEVVKQAETTLEEEKSKRIKIQQKIEEEEKKQVFETDDPNAPELHSKRVITIFSAIFSTIFGAVLMMHNLKEIGNTKARNQVLIFGIAYTILTIAIINLLKLQINLAILLNFVGAAILTEYFWNKFLGKEIKYRKRNWVKPAIISVIITIPFILAIIYGQ